MDEQFLEIFKSIVNVLKKLELLSKDKGPRILLLFLKDQKNKHILIGVYKKLIDAIIYISSDVLLCAEQDKLIPKL